MKEAYNRLATLKARKAFLQGVQSSLEILSREITYYASKNECDKIIAATDIYNHVYSDFYHLTKNLIYDIRKSEQGEIPEWLIHIQEKQKTG